MSGQITYKDKSEKLEKKKVYYEGSDSLKEGYALCYNYDYGAASDAEVGRAWRVEKPATANLKFFAGVVTAEYDGFTGPGLVEIYVPNQRGQKIKVYTDQNCTLGTTILAPKNASYVLGAQTDGYDVARAAQTVNRSVVNGTVLAELYGMSFVQVAMESELALLQAFRPSIASIHSATQSRVLVLESEMSANQAAVVAVDSQLLLVESECAALRSSEASQASVQSAMKSAILVLQGHQASTTSALSAVSAAVAGLGAAAVGSLASAHSQTQSRVLVLESEMSAVQGLATAVDSQLLIIESEVAACRASEASQASVQSAILVEVNAVSQAVVAVDSQLLLVESECAALRSSEASQASVQSAMKSAILVLQGHQASTTSALSAVSHAVSTNLGKINSQASVQSAITSRVLVLESEMSANQAAVTAVDSQLLLVESECAALRSSEASQASIQSTIASRVLVLESEVSAVQGLATAVDSQLLLIESEAATNLTKINSQASTQSAIQVEVNAVSQAVVAVDSQLLLIESEAAALRSSEASQASVQSAIASRLLILEQFAWQAVVSDRVTAPTEVETQGTRYLIIATASGIFTGHEGKIVTAKQNNPTLIGHWKLDTPVEGWTTYVLDENAWYVYDGANWNKESVDALQSQVLLLESHQASATSALSAVSLAIQGVLASEASQASLQSAIASRVLVLESEVSAVQAGLNEISVTSQYNYSNIGVPSSINIKKTRLTIDGVVYKFVSNISAVA